jgi:hypothetical protein
VLTHAAVVALNHSGVARAVPDGYSRPYVYAYALGQLGWVSLGFYVLYLIACKYFAQITSALAVAGAVFGTGLLHYTAVDLMMSHAASFFSLTWCLHDAIMLRARPDGRTRWLRLGLASALVVMTRLQNGVYLIIPAVAILQAVARAGWRPNTSRVFIGPLLFLAGLVVGFLPQLLAWKWTMGMWAANSYSAETSFSWFKPHLIPILSLLLKWLPVLILGIGGCLILAWRRNDPLVLSSAIGTLLSIYVSASWWAWSIAERTSFDNLATIALGLGWAFSNCARFSRWCPWVGAALLMLWNVPFAIKDCGGEPSELLLCWSRALRLLL